MVNQTTINTTSSGTGSYTDTFDITYTDITSTDSTGTTWTDGSGKWSVRTDPVIITDPDAINEMEEIPLDEIDEDTQKEIDKIGKPGKRNLDDLLSSFKIIKNSKEKKLSFIDQMDEIEIPF